jgi:hypothetical protein
MKFALAAKVLSLALAVAVFAPVAFASLRQAALMI